MAFKKTQINLELERERFSSFVVDLRQQVQKTENKVSREIAADLKKARHLEKQALKKLRRSTKIKQNLLRSEMLKSPRNRRFFLKLAWPQFNFFEFFSFQSKSGRFALSRALSKKEKNWRYHSRLKVRRRPLEERFSEAQAKVVWYRSLLSFSLVLLLIIVPLKLLSYFEFFNLDKVENKILKRTQLAMTSLLAATEAVSRLDLKTADSQFQSAGQNFLAAQESLNKINDSLLSLAAFSSDPKLKLAAESKKFLLAGAIASSLGRNLVGASDSLFNGPKDNLALTLSNFSAAGNKAVADAIELKEVLSKINPDNLPDAYREKFLVLSEQTNLLADSLADFVATADHLKEVLGLSRDKRYLLVFQNNAELRASGGFLGSYALVDIRGGKIRRLEVPGGGSYDTEAGLNRLVVAPEPLWLVNPLWHFWDANWWPDWPTTAKNLMWFYEKSDGPTVDGVISVTPTVVERLLEITGPIDLSQEYGLVIDANNFWDTVQRVVEQKNLTQAHPEAVRGLPASSSPISSKLPLEQGLENNTANKPKKIIGDLLAKILETLPQRLNKDSLFQIITAMEASLSEKQILFYFTDQKLQEEISRRNYGGEIRATSRDYLMVINTNIAGQKSDRKCEERIEHTSTVATSGAVTNVLKIYRTHTGLKNEALVGVRNVDWLRVYVPLGSELISATGFRIPDASYFDEKPEADWEENADLENEKKAEIDPGSGTKIYEENGKTVFANWLMVDPGETAVVTITYRLPFNFFARSVEDSWLKRLNQYLNPEQADLLPYSLLVQKQAGAKPSVFNSTLSLPSGAKVFWRYPENLLGTSGWEIKEALNADKYYSVLLEKK